MKKILPIILLVGLLVGCSTSKETQSSSNIDMSETKIESSSDMDISETDMELLQKEAEQIDFSLDNPNSSLNVTNNSNSEVSDIRASVTFYDNEDNEVYSKSYELDYNTNKTTILKPSEYIYLPPTLNLDFSSDELDEIDHYKVSYTSFEMYKDNTYYRCALTTDGDYYIIKLDK